MVDFVFDVVFGDAGRRSGLLPRDGDDEGVVTNVVNGDVHGVNVELVGNEELDVFLGQFDTLDLDLNGDGEALVLGDGLRAVFTTEETRSANGAIEAIATFGLRVLADGTSAVRAARSILSNAVVVVFRAVTIEGRADNGAAVVSGTADGAASVFYANGNLTVRADNIADKVVVAFTLFTADRAAVIVVNGGDSTVLAHNGGASDSGAVDSRNADLAATAQDSLFTITALDLRASLISAELLGAADGAAVIRTPNLLFTFTAFNFRAFNVGAARNANRAALARRNNGALVVSASNLSASGGGTVRAFSALASRAVTRVLLVTIGAVQVAGNRVANRSVLSADFAAVTVQVDCSAAAVFGAAVLVDATLGGRERASINEALFGATRRSG